MAGVLWSIDPVSEDAGNAEFPLVDNTNWFVTANELPPPPADGMYASSADTEGDPAVQYRYRNRQIKITLRVTDTTASALETRLYDLGRKADKLRREGGTLKLTTPTGDTIVFDVLYATYDPTLGRRYVKNLVVELTVSFECKPFGRGASVTLGDNTEASLPCLVFTHTGIAGDVPAEAKLVIDEDDADSQWWVIWGVQSRYYDSATSAALYYEAESRTVQGGAATAVGPTGASGGGSNTVLQGGLTTSYQSMLSTQASGGGAHLSHVGDFRVFARFQTPTSNTGAVKVAFEWAEGDFRRFTRNSEVALYPSATNLGGWEGTWRLVDLGQVHLTKVAQGTQRWEGRILATSTVPGDDIYLDYLMFIPVTEGSGEVSAVLRVETPSAFTARDEFDQTAGNLSGKTLPVGGTWSGAGDADDFTIQTTDRHARRAVTSDSSVDGGRFAIAGTSTPIGTIAQVDLTDLTAATTGQRLGVFARYTDTTHYLAARVLESGSPITAYVELIIDIGSGATSLGQVDTKVPWVQGAFYTIRLVVDGYGRTQVLFGNQGAQLTAYIDVYHAALATGGALASGKVGLYDANSTGSSHGHEYDNFWASALPADAAMFASQSLEIRADRVIREDSGGTIWQAPSQYEGDYLQVPPAGKEARTVRFIVKGCRSDPTIGPDSGIDDISARLTYTPRYLVVPA